MEENNSAEGMSVLTDKMDFLLSELSEAFRRDAHFEIKRKILGMIRQVEKEIKEFNSKNSLTIA